jgi:hypothetical protein
VLWRDRVSVYSVCVDDRVIGKIGQGQEVCLSLPCGIHTVRLSTWKFFGSPLLTVDVVPLETTTVMAKPSDLFSWLFRPRHGIKVLIT